MAKLAAVTIPATFPKTKQETFELLSGTHIPKLEVEFGDTVYMLVAFASDDTLAQVVSQSIAGEGKTPYAILADGNTNKLLKGFYENGTLTFLSKLKKLEPLIDKLLEISGVDLADPEFSTKLIGVVGEQMDSIALIQEAFKGGVPNFSMSEDGSMDIIKEDLENELQNMVNVAFEERFGVDEELET